MRTQAQAIHDAIHGSGGFMEQAKTAKANGTLTDFFGKLVTKLGPILGPAIRKVIEDLLAGKQPAPA